MKKDLSWIQALVLTPEKLAELREAVRKALPAEQAEIICACLEIPALVVQLLQEKNMTIAKLQRLVFGASTESSKNLGGKPPKGNPKCGKPKKSRKGKGHGRLGQDKYPGARRVKVKHPKLKAGDPCPNCKKGNLRDLAEPARTIELSARAPVEAVIHELERLRCNTCGEVFTAPAPPEVKPEKYDPSVGVMAGVMRYGCGMPFYRLEQLQKNLGVPLPSSVQWEQARQSAEALEPILDHLIYLGAQAKVFYNDDTTMRVKDLRERIQEEDGERTGIFTSGIVCEGLKHPIRLFFTGRNHAGENLAQVLEKREEGLPVPMHMCDGLSRNDPKGHETVACHCGVHARRNFVEVRGAFPEECQRVVESFAVVYGVEGECEKDGLDDHQRLQAHQEQSKPVMEKLKSWFTEQLEGKRVEPNSMLGKAMNYMLKRWETLTRFLKEPGAPIDNNVSERLLKTAIMHRKNSLHYRTERGAQVGDLFMSLIQTSAANGVNAFEFMVEAVRHAKEVMKDPSRWMPWNYKETLEALKESKPKT